MPEPHRSLILETSGRIGHVALAEGPALRASRQLDEPRQHARKLTTTLRSLLDELGWCPQDIQHVIVSRGPGSYTGLRVGIMSAATFAYATGCLLHAVDTFAVTAAQTPQEAPSVDVLADAQKDRVYVQRYARESSSNIWRPQTELTIQRVEEWLEHRHAGAWLTGPGLARWAHRMPADAPQVDLSLRHPLPASLLASALPRINAGQGDSLWTVEPLYLRPSAAEEQWDHRQAQKSVQNPVE